MWRLLLGAKRVLLRGVLEDSPYPWLKEIENIGQFNGQSPARRLLGLGAKHCSPYPVKKNKGGGQLAVLEDTVLNLPNL